MNRDRLVNLILGVAIALLPLYTRLTHSVTMSRVSQDTLYLFIILFCTFLLGSKKRKIPFSVGLIGFISSLWVIFNQWEISSINVQMQSIQIIASLVFFYAYLERHEGETTKFVLNGMSIGCIIQSCLGIFEYLGFNAYGWVLNGLYSNIKIGTQSGTFFGSLTQSNLYAAYVSITAISLFRLNFKKFIYFPILALILCKSLMGICSFVAGASYLMFANLGYSLYFPYFTLSLVFALCFLFGVNGADTERFSHWKLILQSVDLKHFLIGHGAGWFHDSQLIKKSKFVQEHNVFLAVFNIFGIGGIVSFLWVLIKAIPKKDYLLGSILFALYCNFHGHFTLNVSTTVIIFVLILSISLSKNNLTIGRA
jgi:hypothetical protein